MKKNMAGDRGWMHWGITGTMLLAMLALLAGCGGGGNSGSSTTATGVTLGEIEAFGSIIVNGVEFEVEGAEVEFEHGIEIIDQATPGKRQDDLLHEGMQVEVEVEFNNDGKTGTATRIIVDDELEGEVGSLDNSNQATTGVVTFMILGQQVEAVDGITRIDDRAPLNGNLANVANGMFVEVHGYPDGSGHIQASYIEWKAVDLAGFNALPGNEGEFELTGVIDSIDPLNQQFSLGTQLVDYSGTLPDGALAIGTLVEVKGTLTAGTLFASMVHVEDGLGPNIPKVEIEGLVRELTATTFSINGQKVDYSTATFVGGTEADLADGMKVEAEGRIDATSLLVAKTVKFRDSFRYEGEATKLADGSWQINNPDPAGIDLIVWVDVLTRDDANLAADGAGTTRNLRLRARQIAGPELIATRTRDNGGGGGKQIFQAKAIFVADPLVEMLDDGSGAAGLLSFDTTPSATLQATDFLVEDQTVPRNTFIVALSAGDVLKARYDGVDEDEIGIEQDN